MEQVRRDAFADATPQVLARTMPTDAIQSVLSDASWWLTGGASLLLWTAIALVLTAS